LSALSAATDLSCRRHARPQRSEQRQIDLICISQLTSPRETMTAPNGGYRVDHVQAL
jgi:hypothetical protein